MRQGRRILEISATHMQQGKPDCPPPRRFDAYSCWILQEILRPTGRRSCNALGLVLLELALQRPKTDPQPLGGLGPVPADLAKGLEDRIPLDLFHRLVRHGRTPGRLGRPLDPRSSP